MSSTPETEDAGDGSDDASYTHDPETFDEGGKRVDEPPHPAAADREFDWRGWILIGVLGVAFVIAPLIVYLRPPALPYWVSLIVMPMVPALLLGVVAVWATTRP